MKGYKVSYPMFVPNNPSPLSSPVGPQHKEESKRGREAAVFEEREEYWRGGVDQEEPEEAGATVRGQSAMSTALRYSEESEGESSSRTNSDDEGDMSMKGVDYRHVPAEFFNRLRTFSLFKHAPPSFHTKVVSKLKLMQYHPQEYIIKMGDPSKSMYWILKGTVSVSSMDGESVYAELASGSFFGEIGILFNRPRTATVVARTKVLVGVLTSDALNVVLKYYPLIERRIRDEAQERLAMQEKKNKFDIPSTIVKKGHYKPSANDINASNIATASTLMPGPSIPPVTPSPVTSSTDNVDSTISIQDFIKNLPLFENLPDNIIHQLALGVEPMHSKPFENVFHKDDVSSDIYFVVNGEVEVIDYLKPDSKFESILARLGSGSYFGEMSFLSFLNDGESYKRSATVRSVSSVELIVVRSDKLQELCKKYPFVIDHMKRTAKERSELNYSKCSNSRLSINYLINEDSVLNQKEARLAALSTLSPQNTGSQASYDSPSVTASDMSSIFSPHWNFNAPTESESGSLSISATPNSFNEEKAAKGNNNGESSSTKKRKTDEHIITVPNLNPVVPSINNFQQLHQQKPSFQYIPHNKRIRLSYSGRWRSSVLSHNGPLSDTILLKLFEYLSLPDLMKLRSVCRRWRQLLYSASNLCKSLDLTSWNTSIDDKALISIIDFVGSRPEIIDISNCFHITDEGFSYMVNEIGISGQIKILKMKSNWEVSAMAIMDLTVPSVGKDLEEIDLSNCRKVRDSVVERLLGWDKDFEGSLPIGEDQDVEQVGCKELKILNVGYCKHLTDNVMFHIANHANKRLESLDLTRCTTITDRGFQYWTYRAFPNLKKLSLKDCTFLSDKSIISIANSANNLEILDLNFCCALSDISIEVLCLGCPKLRELDLSFCGSAVSDSSLVAISLHMRSLERLILKGCIRVTRAGIDALLSGCCPLTYINVSQCRNAHIYPGSIPAQKLNVNPQTKSAFVTAGPYQNIIEIVI